MPKGSSSPSGTTTVVQNTANPTQNAQLPYLTGQAGLGNPADPSANFGWNQAINLAAGDPFQYYPGQTLANQNPSINAGYQGLIDSGYGNKVAANLGDTAFKNGVSGGYGVTNSPAYNMYQGLENGANAPFNEITGLRQAASNDSVTNSPAYNAYQGIVNGANAPFNEITGLRGAASTATAGNAGTNQLAATANGAYLGSNPYLASEYAAAAQPVINAYQTATAPQTDSNFEAAGRYGSGALANAQSQNQLNLGTTLGNLSANLYGQDYANERGLQTNAAGTLGSLTNAQNQLEQSAFNSAGNLLGQEQTAQLNAAGGLQSGFQAGNQLGQSALTSAGGLLGQEQATQLGAANGLQAGFQAGNTATNQALLMEPNVLSGNLEPNQAITAGGQGLTSQDQLAINDAIARFYGNQQAPWQTNTSYLNMIGQPTSGTLNSSTTSPYFTNSTANLLGAGLGGLGLFNGLNTATGGSLGSGLSSALGGIFGGDAGAGTVAALSSAFPAGGIGAGFGGSLLDFLGAAAA